MAKAEQQVRDKVGEGGRMQGLVGPFEDLVFTL